MSRSHVTHEDAMTFWRARDVYRVQAVCKGLLLAFWGVQLLGYAVLGYWWLGPLAVALQWGLLWGVRWVLRWVGRVLHRGLWWGVDQVQRAVPSRPHIERR
jgi:hypothetical protein